MAAKSPEEIAGLEFDWLASDANGHVALFTTAGGGYAPAEFLKDTEAHDDAIAAIVALAATTRARIAPQLPAEFANTWRDVAERGLFAFDSTPGGGSYRLVAVPEHPIQVAELPSVAASLVRGLCYATLKFSELETISAEALAGVSDPDLESR